MVGSDPVLMVLLSAFSVEANWQNYSGDLPTAVVASTEGEHQWWSFTHSATAASATSAGQATAARLSGVTEIGYHLN